MLGNPGTYANKKRKKPVLKQKKISDGNEVVKSNPSKRHRDRLNGELDRLMDLLPFSEEVRSRLDKLSVLRLSVGYLRVKSHFKATMKRPGANGQGRTGVEPAPLSEGELLIKALSGFVVVVTSDGLVFYSSPTIKDYLGFHQSDVIHQSVFDLIHTDDRSMFREQLHFALNPPPLAGESHGLQGGGSVAYHPDQLPPENSSFLERSFVCRFRCLLDNSSGFLALKFQGRLKYLHGQSPVNGSKPRLALFAVAAPVQQPSIVEIRAKMLLFQTKHRLDFTPMGIDSRGKIILGYSEVELCMKGSGYQFIHAADMMYCADNHIRMIKTGESGLTVFRLLTKSGGWVWVKSNAKLIFKAGRPEFIIAYQRALSNPEGEAYLRQRRLELPFGFTTGEGILYNTTPTVDVAQFQFNKLFEDVSPRKKMTPTSLLDCFLNQDEAIYSQAAEVPLPMDQVFMDSRALLSVTSNSWQDAADSGDGPTAVKREAKQSVTALIDSLEKMADSGDFNGVLQNLDVDEATLTELETALKDMSQGGEQQSGVTSDLDSILTNDMFEYIDSVLFKEKAEDCLDAVSPRCLSGLGQQDVPVVGPFSPLCEPHAFQTAGLYPQQQAASGGGVFTHRLSHQALPMPAPTGSLPPIQQLQLQDIFSASIELPQLAVPPGDAPARLHPPGPAGLQQASQLLLYPDGLQTPADTLPPLIPSRAVDSSDVAGGLSVSCGQESLQPWPQQTPPHAGVLHSRQDKTPSFQDTGSLSLQSTAGFFPGAAARLNPAQQQQQGALAGARPASQSSCMFSSPGVGGVTALPGGNTYRGPSPPQGSCFYPWSHSEPAVGTLLISQQDGAGAGAGPLTAASSSQLHLDASRHLQQNGGIPAEHNGFFLHPARDLAAYMME